MRRLGPTIRCCPSIVSRLLMILLVFFTVSPYVLVSLTPSLLHSKWWQCWCCKYVPPAEVDSDEGEPEEELDEDNLTPRTKELLRRANAKYGCTTRLRSFLPAPLPFPLLPLPSRAPATGRQWSCAHGNDVLRVMFWQADT